MPVVSLGSNTMMGTPNQVPYDLQAQQAEVQRQVALMQQLLQSANRDVPATVPGSGRIVVPNYAGALGKVLESGAGLWGQQNLAGQQAAIAAQQQKVAGDEARQFVDLQSGGSYPMKAGPGDAPETSTLTTRPNMVEAIKMGLGAKTELVRKMAEKAQEKKTELDLAGQIRDLDRAKLADKFIPGSMPAGSDPSTWKTLPHIVTQDGMTGQVTPGVEGFTAKPVPLQRYKDVQPATAGTPPVQYAEGTNEAKGFQGGAQVPENVANQADINERIKIMSAGREKVIAAIGTLQNNAYAKTLLNDMKQESFGPAANLATLYNNFLSQAGWPTIPENTSREELAGVLAKNVRDHAKALSPTSNVDVEGLRRDLGSVISSKAGVERLLNVIDQTMLPVIIGHEKFVDTAAKNKYFPPDIRETYGVNPADYGIDLPKLRDYRSGSGSTTLSGTAAMEAMPENMRSRIEQETEANPGIPRGPITYDPGTVTVGGKKQAPISRFPTAAPNPNTASDQEIIEYLRRQREQRGQRR